MIGKTAGRIGAASAPGNTSGIGLGDFGAPAGYQVAASPPLHI
jgi:hypothetical protein